MIRQVPILKKKMLKPPEPMFYILLLSAIPTLHSTKNINLELDNTKEPRVL
jgi:hypothetical protein